jgi:rSAM/selenodomain-associated transferase 2
MLSIDVVMPVLNEQREVETALSRLEQHAFDRLIVVDGGSDDQTVEIARSWADQSEGRVLLQGAQGRGAQMNTGAAVSTADVLLFLHCDCTLPRAAPALIRSALLSQGDSAVAGAFVVRTLREGHRGWTRRLLWLADLRSRYARHPYGDQAVFIRRAVFDAIGGFPEITILEDLAFAREVARRGQIVRIPKAVMVSSRRFRGSPIRTGALMRAIPFLARVGVPLDRVAALYPQNR